VKELEGSQAPDFVLPGSDGKPHSLKNYRDKYVVMYFYPKDNTPGCAREACGFRDIYAKLKKAGVIVLGVSKDSFASHGKFIAKYKLPFVLLSDTTLETMKMYGAWGEKKMYGKTVQGTIRSSVLINPEGKILKHWTTVKNTEEHPEEVLEYIHNKTK